MGSQNNLSGQQSSTTCRRRGSDRGRRGTIIGSECEYRANTTRTWHSAGGGDGPSVDCGKFARCDPHASWSMDVNGTMTGSTPASDAVQVNCVRTMSRNRRPTRPGCSGPGWMNGVCSPRAPSNSLCPFWSKLCSEAGGGLHYYPEPGRCEERGKKRRHDIPA